MYIRKERQKTKTESIVPLHPIAEIIISHYQKEPERDEVQQTVKEEGDHFVFHRDYSRNVTDTKLSIMGKTCDTRRRFSYHMARYAFGTMSLSTGIPTESIAKMMGHASMSSIQVHAQITDRKIPEDMDRPIAKRSAGEKKTSEREACKSSDIVTRKTEESARR